MGRCEVQNGVGEMSKTIFLDVQVPVYFEVPHSNQSFCANFAFLPFTSRFPFPIKFCISPLWQVGSTNRTAIVSQDATLVCNAFGDQPISIVWRKVGAQ